MTPLPNWFSRKSKDAPEDAEVPGQEERAPERPADAGLGASQPAAAGVASSGAVTEDSAPGTPSGSAPSPVSGERTWQAHEIEAKVIEQLRTVFDPEIPVNIYELGLIYGIDVSPANAVTVHMTLTAPNCPAAESMPEEVRQKTRAVDGVTDATVDITFEPPWDPSRMTEAAKLELGFF